MNCLVSEKMRESEGIELKKTLNDTFVKEAVAYLNTCSGNIYIGIIERVGSNRSGYWKINNK